MLAEGCVRRTALSLALALAPLAGAAGAGEKAASAGGVMITASSSWPTALNHGWQPLFVRADNGAQGARRVMLSFQCWNGPERDTINRSFVLPAGGSERFELSVPVRSQFDNGYNVLITVGGEVSWLSDVGAEQTAQNDGRVVLVVASAAHPAESVARWTTQLSDEARPRSSVAGQEERAIRVIGGKPAAKPEPVQVASTSHAWLPSIPSSYTSLDALKLDAREWPAGAPAEALLGWVRTGGLLAISGIDSARATPIAQGVAPWMEPRFLVRSMPGFDLYAMGHGLLLVGGGLTPFADAAEIEAFNAALEMLRPWQPMAQPDVEPMLVIPGIDVPFRPLTLILLLFAILVGPVNLILVRRSRRPALLLITIPAIALVFSVGLFAYGAVAQGLDVRAASHSRTVLDQRTHNAATVEKRLTFAGLSVGAGLRPGPGVTCLRKNEAGYRWHDQREYVIELDDGVLFADGWLPVRTPTDHTFLIDRAARGRIEIAREADGWTASNGLDAPVRALVLRDARGDLHRFQGPIAPGRKAQADPTGPDGPEVARWRALRPLPCPLADGEWLPAGSWCAELESSPFVDACGIDYREVISQHTVLGILDMGEQR